MGRIPYLTRLALGRSAFEPFDFDHSDPSKGNTTDATGQSYDSSGRPVNPAATARNEALVRAKNEVLEAVGVTERSRHRTFYADEGHVSLGQAADALAVLYSDTANAGADHDDLPDADQTRLDALEDELGDDASLITDLLHLGLTWWMDTLRRRVQAGIVPTDVPFTALVAQEWHIFSAGNAVDKYHFLTAGLTLEVFSNFLLRFGSYTVYEYITRHRDRVWSDAQMDDTTKQSRLKYWKRVRSVTEAGLRLAIVPMSVISLLQQLRLLKVEANLTTAWMLLPWHASSPYQWAWLPGSSMLPVGTRLFYTMLSPITLRFFSQVSSDWIHNFGNFVRDYGRQPAILGPKAPQTDKADHAADCQKRTSFLLRPLVFLRDELLDLTGWSYWSYLDGPNQGVLRARSLGAMLALDDRDDEGPVDAETSSDVEPYLLPQARRRFQRMSSKNGRPSRKAWPKFKTTRLSMLPADILGHRLHEVVWTILKAPINILLYRSLVCAWQVQTLGSATLPDAPGNGRLGAFGRALLSNLKNEKWGALAARMGLCLAAEAVVDALVWGGVYCFASSFGVGEKRSQRLPPEHLST